MDEQKSLFPDVKSRGERIFELKEYYFTDEVKIIADFGDYDSKILILGISPVQTHYASNSKSCFAFDISTEQTERSGGVLCRVFERLGIRVEDVLWDNIYKFPLELLDEAAKENNIKYIEEFIKIIKPTMIIVLGNDCESVVNKLKIDNSIKIRKVMHPAVVCRGFYTFEEYYKNWERLSVGDLL